MCLRGLLGHSVPAKRLLRRDACVAGWTACHAKGLGAVGAGTSGVLRSLCLTDRTLLPLDWSSVPKQVSYPLYEGLLLPVRVLYHNKLAGESTLRELWLLHCLRKGFVLRLHRGV